MGVSEMDLTGARVMVTGGGGFLGRRIVHELEERGATPIVIRSADYDLTEPERVRAALQESRAEYVIHAAAVVGGIGANREHPGGFFYANAVMGVHLIHEAWRAGIRKLVIVGTVCSYPKYTEVPFREEDLWSGYPEETNAPYGLAKKMLLVQAQAYRDEYGFDSAFVIPTNLYGPGDNFDQDTSHVIPAIIRKCVEARGRRPRRGRPVGDGKAHSRVPLRRRRGRWHRPRLSSTWTDRDPVNLGSATEISIVDLAELIAKVTGFKGRFVWDPSKPDGQPRRAVDGSKARELLGWSPRVDIEEGLRRTVEWYREAVLIRDPGLLRPPPPPPPDPLRRPPEPPPPPEPPGPPAPGPPPEPVRTRAAGPEPPESDPPEPEPPEL